VLGDLRDRGPRYGAEGGPIVDEERYLEIWNLVFMQYAIDEVHAKDDFRVVRELSQKNIDTGMGLERVALLLQGVENMYEIDEVFPVIEMAQKLSGRSYGANPRRRRPDADRRRPRPLGAHAHQRRRRALQRGPGLRAATAAAPGGAVDAPAGRPRTGRSRRCSPSRATR